VVVKADEIRKLKFQVNGFGAVVPSTWAILLQEIAAQLADLNENLRKHDPPTSDWVTDAFNSEH
jgi:hypothetical protein